MSSITTTADRHARFRPWAFARRNVSEIPAASATGTSASKEAVYTVATARALSAAVNTVGGARSATLFPFRAQPANHAGQLGALALGERTIRFVEQRRDGGGP